MADDVSVPGPPGSDGNSGKLFGLPTPMVLIGGGALVLLFLARSMGGSKQDNSNLVPMSTAVQLGDIQERQLEIVSGLQHGFSDASAERANYNQSQLQALATTQQTLLDRLGVTEQTLQDAIEHGDQRVIDQQTATKNQLTAMLDAVQAKQDSQFSTLLGNISSNQFILTRWADYINSILAGFSGNSGGTDDTTPPGTNPLDSSGWYKGWQAAFGQSGGKYDVNKDNRVDILDFGIWRDYIASRG